MSLDLLISKYLDGELTFEEDVKLRQQISSSKAAKAEFDAAVLLNAAFKEDAESIKTPADVVSRTEDIILMKIFNDGTSANSRNLIKSKRRYRFAPALAFMMAVFVIGTVFTSNIIDEGAFAIVGNQTSEQETVNPIIENITLDVANASVPNNSVSRNTSNVSAQRRIAATPPSNEEIITHDSDVFAGDIQLFIDENLPTIAEAEIDSFVEYELAGAAILIDEASSDEMRTDEQRHFFSTNRAFGKNLSIDLKNQQQTAVIDLSFFDPLLSNTEVHLATFYSRDYINNMQHKDSKPISSFSQSVAYQISNRHRIGLEVGITDYGYDHRTMIRVPSGPSTLSTSIEGLNPSEIGNSILVPITLYNQSQLYWVSTFWDFDILKSDMFSLHSRLGGGASVEGTMLYGRILGKMQLYGPLYLNIGAETKAFEARVSASQKGVLRTGSIIYGVQVIF